MPDKFDEILADMDRDPFATLTGEPQMATIRPPRATPAPAAAPMRAEVTEILPPAGDVAQVPVPLSKLGKAMEAVKSKLTVIDQFGKDVRDLIANNPKDKKYDLSTKDGEKSCDEVRKTARAKRLAIQNAWTEGKQVLRTLGDDLKAAAEGDINTLQAIEDNAKTQLDAKAQAEKDRKARHEANLAAITALAEGLEDAASETVTQRMNALEAIVVDDSYEEYRPAAERKLREVHDTLTGAFTAAMAREKAAAAERERQAQLAAELATAREKEERATRIKAKIQTIKDLPGQVDGTDADNIRLILRQHEASVPDAQHYGDLLEFAEMAHELTTTKLRDLLAKAEADETATVDLFPTQENSVESPEAGLLSNLPHDEPEPETEPDEDPFSTPIKPPADEALKTALHAIEEKFGKATTEERHAAPAARGAIPSPRGTWRASAPAATPAPTPEPEAAPGAVSEDEHDLLADARAVLAAYDDLKAYPGSEAPMSMVMKGRLGQSMEKLRATIVFLNEFAD